MTKFITEQIDVLKQAITAQEKLREHVDDTIVDATIAVLSKQLSELKKQLDATAQQPVVEQQRKQVIALFVSISGFTALSEMLDVEEVSNLMNALWLQLDKIIAEHGGYIDKHMGGVLMALWGVESVREHDSEQALKAALAMQKTLIQFTQTNPLARSALRKSNTPLRIQVGIDIGPVLLGKVGTTAEYTAIGEAVNLAKKLQETAPLGGILISHNLYQHIHDMFEVLEQAVLNISGKAKPIKTYLVKQIKEHSLRIRIRAMKNIKIPLIGRINQLAHLQTIYYNVINNKQLQMVTIVSEAGLGKSRLLYEFNNWVELQPEQSYKFQARASEQAQGSPYFLIRDLFAFCFGIADSDSRLIVQQKMVQGITKFMNTDNEEKAHFIGHMIGYRFTDSTYLESILADPKQIKARGFHYLIEFFTTISQQQPIQILIEDIHWADDASLNLIKQLAQACRQQPIWIICTTRPALFSRISTWAKQETWHTKINLPPLSKEETNDLVDEILQNITDIPLALRNLIVDNAAGNPFYVEELTKMLLDEGVIVKENETWHVVMDNLKTFKIPTTLAGILQTRLDALPIFEKEILKLASIVGRIFWDKTIVDLIPKETELASLAEQLLEALCNRELILKRDTSIFADMQEYAFKHTLLHEVTYNLVLLRDRCNLHTQVADWLIEHNSDRIAEYAGLIAEHYDQAQQPDQAAIWYGAAGRQSQDTSVPDAAIKYYNRALELLSNQPSQADGAIMAQRLPLYQGISEMYLLKGHYAEAIQSYTAMLTTALTHSAAPAQAKAWCGLSTVQITQGNYRAALESANQAEQLFRNDDATIETDLALALYCKGWALYRLGNSDEALLLGEEALEISNRVNDNILRLNSLNLLATIHDILSQYQTALDYQKEALTLAHDLGNREREAVMLNNLAEIIYATGDYIKALIFFSTALPIAREIGYQILERSVLSNMGGVRIQLGEYTAAEADLLQVIEMGHGEGFYDLPKTYYFLALAYLRQDNIQAALSAAKKALTLAQTSENPEEIGLAWWVLGQLASFITPLSIDGEDYSVTECLANSLQIFQEHSMLAEQAHILNTWSTHARSQGDVERAKAMWHKAHTIYKRLNLPLHIERMGEQP